MRAGENMSGTAFQAHTEVVLMCEWTQRRPALSWCLAIVLACVLFGCADMSEGTGTDRVMAQAAHGDASYATEIVPLQNKGIDLYLARMRLDGTDPDIDILLLHGSSLASKEFDCDYGDYSLARRLAREGYSVWLLDVAGYGQSGEVADGRSIDTAYAATDVEAAVDTILGLTGHSHVDILGWSWGTMYGSAYAIEHPDTVRRLVLYGPIAKGLGIEGTGESFHTLTWEDAAEDFQRSPDGSIDATITDPTVVDVFCSDAWRYNPASVPAGWQKDACMPTDVTLIDFSKISVPCLLIFGDRDPYMDLDLLHAAADVLASGSKIEEVAGASHAMMLERPYHQTFQDAVVDFLVTEA